MSDFSLIPNSQLKNIASNGNGFSKIEHAEAVAKNRKGKEAIVEKDGTFFLYESFGKDQTNINSIKKSDLNIIEIIDEKNKIYKLAERVFNNVQTPGSLKNNSDGIKGVGEKLSTKDIKNYASNGNNFRKFTDAESIAKKLNYNTAIVQKDNIYYLYHISLENANKFLKGNNNFIDGKVAGIVKNGATLSNWSFESETRKPNNKIAYTENNKIMLKGKEFKISGINVYDLADVAHRSQSELESTLKTIASSGANTVRFWAFTKSNPQDFIKIFDTSKNLGLDLKFIPVLGDHWEHIESFRKNDKWYAGDYKTQDMVNKPKGYVENTKDLISEYLGEQLQTPSNAESYLQHVKETIPLFTDRDEILMIELMNEPEAKHNTLKGFADDVSTTIRNIYSEKEKQTGQEIPKHLISLGTLGGTTRQGMVGHDYKDLYTLPNIDVVTAHDYTFNDGESKENTVAPVFTDYLKYAKELNKPFFLGEIGIKVRKDGVENSNNPKLRSNEKAMDILQNRIKAYEKLGFSGGLVWGPQPDGKAVDGSGHGFSYKSGDKVEQNLKNVFQEFKD